MRSQVYKTGVDDISIKKPKPINIFIYIYVYVQLFTYNRHIPIIMINSN